MGVSNKNLTDFPKSKQRLELDQWSWTKRNWLVFVVKKEFENRWEWIDRTLIYMQQKLYEPFLQFLFN